MIFDLTSNLKKYTNISQTILFILEKGNVRTVDNWKIVSNHLDLQRSILVFQLHYISNYILCVDLVS